MKNLPAKPEEVINPKAEGLIQSFFQWRLSAKQLNQITQKLPSNQENIDKIHEVAALGFKLEDIVCIAKKSNWSVQLAVITSLTTKNSIEALQTLTKPVIEGGFGFAVKDIANILSGSGSRLENAIQCLKLFVINFYHGQDEIRVSKSKEVISEMLKKFSGHYELLLKTENYRLNSDFFTQIKNELDKNSPQPVRVIAPLEVNKVSPSGQAVSDAAQSLLQLASSPSPNCDISKDQPQSTLEFRMMSALLSLASRDENPSTKPAKRLFEEGNEEVNKEVNKRAHKVLNSQGDEAKVRL